MLVQSVNPNMVSVASDPTHTRREASPGMDSRSLGVRAMKKEERKAEVQSSGSPMSKRTSSMEWSNSCHTLASRQATNVWPVGVPRANVSRTASSGLRRG